MERRKRLTTLLAALAGTYFQWMHGLFTLASVEAKVARKSLIRLCCLSVAALALLICTWLFIQVALFLWLISKSFQIWHCALIISGINAFIILIITCLMIRLKRKISFPILRHQVFKH
jgi:Putative Actinobacterial Holin-X, holin superfamily III